MKINPKIRRLIALLLCVCMVVPYFDLGITVSAANSVTSVLGGHTTNDVTLLAGTNADGTQNEVAGATLEETIANYEETYLLGVAADFCVFLKGDFKVKDSDAEGRVAVGGNIVNNTNWEYEIGKGDHGWSSSLDQLITDRKGAATIIMGGELQNRKLGDLYYTNNSESYRILVLNRTDKEPLTNIPESDDSVIDQTQTYAVKLFDFDEVYSGLNSTSEQLHSNIEPTTFIDLDNAGDNEKKKLAALLNRLSGVADLDTLRSAVSGVSTDGVKDSGENLIVSYGSEIWFIYGGEPTDTADSVFFGLSSNYYDAFRLSSSVHYVNIPKLAVTRTLPSATQAGATTASWEYAYIIVDMEGKANSDGRIHISDPSMNDGNNSTYINGINISNVDKGNQTESEKTNNNPGVTSLLYNFYTAPGATVVMGNNFSGTIFAPNAFVTDEYTLGTSGKHGHLSGALIADSFEGATEFGYRPFTGTNVAIAINNAKFSVPVEKDDEDGPLAGATIGLYKLADKADADGDEDAEDEDEDAAPGTLVGKFVSTDGENENEELEDVEQDNPYLFGGLTAGKYVLVEEEAPEGYGVADPIYFEITDTPVNASCTIDTGYTYPAVTYTWDDIKDSLGLDENSSSIQDVKNALEREGYIEGSTRQTYTWGSDITQMAYNSGHSVELEISKYIIQYADGSVKPINATDGINWSDYWWGEILKSGSGNREITTGNDNIVSISLEIKANSNVDNAKFVTQGNNGLNAEVSVNLTTTEQIVRVFPTAGYNEYGGYLPVSTYYKKATTGTSSTGHTTTVTLPGGGTEEVEANQQKTSKTLTFRSHQGTLTVYKDDTFTTKVGETYTSANPLDVENNVYEYEGEKYTIKFTSAEPTQNGPVDSGAFSVYKEGESTATENPGFNLYKVDGGYVVYTKDNNDYKIVYPDTSAEIPLYMLTKDAAGEDKEGPIVMVDEKVGNLEITKTVNGGADANGVELPLTDDDKNQEFTFTITLKEDDTDTSDPAEGESVKVTYKAIITTKTEPGEDPVEPIETEVEFVDGVATVTLKHNQTITIQGLPVGTKYTITETPEEGYVQTQPENGAAADRTIVQDIDGEEQAHAKFENTKNTGNLKLTKTVVDENGDEINTDTQEFTFEVTLSDKSINGVYGDLTFKDGVATIIVKHGDIKYATGLPAGTTYTVREVTIDGYSPTITYTDSDNQDSGQSGTIEFGETVTASVVNKVDDTVKGKLVLRKTVTGTDAATDTTKFKFTITLELDDEPVNKTYTATFDPKNTGDPDTVTFNEEGKAEVELVKGQTITIDGLPIGAEYTIEETNSDGYTVHTSGETGTIDVYTSAAFINHKENGDLTVSKTVVADPGTSPDPNKTFEFTITLTDGDGNPVGGEYTAVYDPENDDDDDDDSGKVEFNDQGKATVKLTGGQTVTIQGLPAGVTYKVEETAVANDGYELTSSTGTESTIPANGTATAAFINTYSVNSVSDAPQVTKKLEGRTLDRNEFTFTMVITGDPKDGYYVESGNYFARNGAKESEAVGTVSFDQITFTKPGTYTVTIKEHQGHKDGVTYDSGEVKFKYVVTDDGQGHLSVTKYIYSEDEGDWIVIPDEPTEEQTAQISDASTFTNTYSEDATTEATLVVTKELSGRPLNDGEFEFVIDSYSGEPADGYTFTPADGVEQVDGKYTAKNDAYGNVYFGTIEFSEAGTYTVTVKEKKGSLPGVTYDEKTITFTYTVEEKDGELGVTVATSSDKTDDQNLDTFENDYTANAASVDVGVTKELVGRDHLTNGEFTFEMTVSPTDGVKYDGNPVSGTITVNNTENGTIPFKAIEFTKAGRYEVTIKETKGAAKDINYDEHVVKMVYKVEDNLNGHLVIAEDYPIVTGSKTFTNSVKTSDLQISKTVVGRNTTDQFEFTIMLTDANGDPVGGEFDTVIMPDNTASKIEFPKEGEDVGKATVTLKHGQTITISGLPVGTTYTVTENKTNAQGDYTTKYNNDETATNATGPITEGTTAEVNVTNTWPTGDLEVSKTVKNGGSTSRMFEFTVTLTGDGTSDINGWYGDMAFKNGVATFILRDGNSKTATGLPKGITYTVTETAVDGYTTTYNDETGPATGEITESGETVAVVNTYNSDAPEVGSLTVSKTVVNDQGLTAANYEAEFEFTVTLYEQQDEEPTVAAINGIFGDMEFTDGKAIVKLKHGESKTATGLPAGLSYTVAETSKAGYAATFTGETGTIERDATAEAAFTNTYSVQSTSDTPQVKKELEGRALEVGGFSFTMSVKGAPIDGYSVSPNSNTAKNDGDGNVTFSQITFSKVGTYYVTITENVGSALGVTYDRRRVTFKYEVVDNGAGKLVFTKYIGSDETGWTEVEGSTIPDDAIFKNTYNANSTTETLAVTKKLEGRELNDSDAFWFELGISRNADADSSDAAYGFDFHKADEVYKNESDGKYYAKNDVYGNVYFGQIEFSQPGTYIATVKEYIPDDDNKLGGVTYTDKTVTFKYEVENVDGELAVKLEITSDDGTDNDPTTFVNTYSINTYVSDAPAVTKTFTDGTLTGDDFTFTMEISPTDGVKYGNDPNVVDVNDGATFTKTNDGDGKVQFENITFTKAGTYYVKIWEVVESNRDDVEYDTHVYWLVYTVEDDLHGGLEITSTESFGTNPTFTNKALTSDLQISKTVVGRKTNDEFTFTITLSDTTINGWYGDMEFSNGVATVKLKHGETKTATGLPVGITYTVVETDDLDNCTTTYNGNTGSATGDITEGETAKVDVVNTWPTGNLQVSKTVTGDGADTDKLFAFTVKLNDTSVNGAYGDMVFTGGVATFTLKHGETKTATGLPAGITYVVVESPATNYTSSHSGNTSGTIPENNTAAVRFVNTYAVDEEEDGSLTITKNVIGSGAEDAETEFEFTVTIYEDETYTSVDKSFNGEYDGVTFTEGVSKSFKLKDGESKTITGLPVNTYYKVTEEDSEGYSQVLALGDTGTITAGETTAAFVNQKNSTEEQEPEAATGNLMVSKIVSGTDGNTNAEFHFTVELSDETINGTYGAMTFTDGKADVTLKHGQSAEATGLPAGVKYEVTETDGDGYTTTVTGGNGTINENKTASAVFINHKDAETSEETGGLTVTKLVTGTAGNTTSKFTITVTLTGTYTEGDEEKDASDINKTYDDMTFTNGVATLLLANGEYATATGLPAGLTYKVEETGADGYTVTYISGQTGTIGAGGTTSVVVRNHKDATTTETPKTGDLTVSKTVSGTAGETDRAFNFVVELGSSITGTYGDMMFTNGKAEFTLKHGESKTATGLPEGTTYTVTEAEFGQDGYTSSCSGNTGKIETNTEKTATFLNVKDQKFGSLTVTKTVGGNAGDTTKEFHFTVSLWRDATADDSAADIVNGKVVDTSVDGAYGDMTFKNGVATFTLKHGENKTATGLPAGSTYTVAETEFGADGYTSTATGYYGSIPENDAAVAIFINTKDAVVEKTGDLVVKKNVTGDAGDTDAEFHFTVTLSDKTINGTYGDMTFKNGVAEFTLKHGESAAALDLPAGITYKVTEAEANQDGYVTTITGASGTITSGGTATVLFVNNKDEDSEELDESDKKSDSSSSNSDNSSNSSKKTSSSSSKTSSSSSSSSGKVESVKTGDDRPIAVWMTLMVLSLAGIVLMGIGKKRHAR